MDAGLVGDLALDQGGAHIGGADAVGGDPAGAALQREHLGQALQAVLGGHIGALVGGGAQAVDRGDVDDPAPAPLVHAGQDRPGEAERRLHHQGQHGREPLGRELLDRGHVLEAGVVDQHVGGQLEAVEGWPGRSGRRPPRCPPSSPATRSAPSPSQVDARSPCAPAAASRRAQASPMPLAPPVTMADLPPRSTPIGPPSPPLMRRSSCFMTLPRALRGNAST